jgi:hypothetical protein
MARQPRKRAVEDLATWKYWYAIFAKVYQGLYINFAQNKPQAQKKYNSARRIYELQGAT